jgi:hypothetical protein
MSRIVLDTSSPAPPMARDLEWVQPRWARPAWELYEGEHRIVTMSRARWYGSEMVAEADGVTLRCMRHGWRETRLVKDDPESPELSFTMYSWGSDEETERLKLSRLRGDGPIARADGSRWFLRQHGFWRERWWKILDGNGRVIVTLRRRFRPFKLEGSAHVEAGIEPADALQAVVFGWYLLMRESHRRHAAH